MKPKYDLDKIKFGIDKSTFERAVDLYENGKVKQFKKEFTGFSAIVLGTKPYRIYVDSRQYDQGDCECYLGQNDTLCKHMIAVAIYGVKGGRKLDEEDKQLVDCPVCSGRVEELTKVELAVIKKSITSALKYIKPYDGPSRIWFAYQDSLSEGCNRLSKIISELPVSLQATEILIGMLLQLDYKLCRSGIDDSDGTVGEFIQETVEVLKEYAKLDSSCVKSFNKLKGRETCFGWEEPLLEIIKS